MNKHLPLLKWGALAAVVSFGFAFALVPLYRLACEKLLGIKFEEGPVEVRSYEPDLSRQVTIEFTAGVNSKLPWQFRAEKMSMKVHPGEMNEATFYAINESPLPIVGQAVPSVAPASVAIYFNKTECFCFTEQLLNPGEQRAMPVRFVVDPDLPQNIDTLTLSYTFFNNEIATQRLRASNALAAGGL
ncbi:cytochrome c oxidase assembly protein [Pseudomarimonas arenosa]|uniref:Cytochrome c oxidase assembly protein CtaG n=1 Tax=Pseudomarimonas arenosa TaxID=2774145 RepID=A0AAW3ZI08_9GAMM|nr:cytochrome c oxidase assembly protein [Pseudomarimonas arenosa]MBD8525720.1 cytochrome c oxidase assembly protein [Pseudomarimonas arenosa]